MNRRIIFAIVCFGVLLVSMPLVSTGSRCLLETEEGSSSFLVNENKILEKVSTIARGQFIENTGQIANERVIFYGEIPGGQIGFAESEIFLVLEGHDTITTLTFPDSYDVMPEGLDTLTRETNYFLGGRGSFENVMSFQRLVYRNLWEGIDLIYRATEAGAKYQFEVSVNADPSEIQIRVDEDASLFVDTTTVRIEQSGEYFIDEGLVATQGEKAIPIQFSQIDKNTFGFDVIDYDTSRKLVIDPLMYSTYIGGAGYDESPQIAVDDNGYVYVAGITQSSEFPLLNEYNDTLWGGIDLFVLKLDPTGKNLIYSTYIGGESLDLMGSLIVDHAGNVYICGETLSQHFPVTQDAINSTSNGFYDFFIMKLNSTGNGIDYASFYGGANEEENSFMTLDAHGNVFVMGRTSSTDFPTKNAYQEVKSTGYDLCVFKLNSSMTGVEYSTYLGGDDAEYSDVVQVDSSGNAYILGSSASTDYPVTPDAYNTSSNGIPDIVVSKLNATGSGLIYSTYIGGSNWDSADFLVADPLGNVYVTGSTESADFPTVNAYNSTYDGTNNDAYLFKLNSTGNGLIYSTFIGGSGDDDGEVVRIDSQGCAYLALETDSTNFPTKSAYDDSHNGNYDIALVKLNSTGNGLEYSTYYGGEGDEDTDSMYLESDGTFYVCGETFSTDEFPILNQFDHSHNGLADVYVFKLATDDTNPVLNSPQDISYVYKDSGNQIQWSASDQNPLRYQVSINDVVQDWVSWAGGTITVDIDGLDPGTYQYSITVEDEFGYSAQDSVTVTVLEDSTAPDVSSPDDIQFNLGETGYEISWSVGDRSPGMYRIERIPLFGESTVLEYSTWTNGTIVHSIGNLTVGVYQYVLTLFDENGNSVSDEVLVQVIDDSDPEINSPVDVSYVEGTTGHSIDWIVSDDNPDSFELSRNGVTLIEGDWDGSNFSIDVSMLSVGEYIFTLTVRDTSGNWVSDSVTVAVTSSATTSDTTETDGVDDYPDLLLLIVGVVVVAIVIVIIVALAKRKR